MRRRRRRPSAGRTARRPAGSTTRSSLLQTVGAIRIARGPNRAPGRDDTASSSGAPTIATSARGRPQALVVGRPRQLLERAVPIGVVRQILGAELRELVVAAQLALLDPEVACVPHGHRSIRGPTGQAEWDDDCHASRVLAGRRPVRTVRGSLEPSGRRDVPGLARDAGRRSLAGRRLRHGRALGDDPRCARSPPRSRASTSPRDS